MDNNKMKRYGKLTKYFAMKTREKKVPFSGTFELTPLCNMNCKMCYIRMSKEEMERVGKSVSIDRWLQIAKEAVKEGMVMLLLTGGEALLYKDFKNLFIELRKMGLFISINTNATLIDDKWIEFFKQYPPAQFNVTIYGGCNETYNRLCGNPKGYDLMKDAVEKLQSNGFQVHLNATFTKQNIQDMEAVYAFAREHNLIVHGNTYCFPPVRKEGVLNPEEDRFTAREAAKARVRLNWNSINDKEKFINRIDSICKKRQLLEDKEEVCGELEGEKIRCAAGRSNFWITWDGRMLPCGMVNDFAVKLNEDNFKDAWDKITEHSENIRLTPQCVKCPDKDLCLPCVAKVTAETGTYNEKPEYLCEYIREYIELLRKAKNYLENE